MVRSIAGNKVLRWEICESHYDREKQVAVAEWVFECMYEYKMDINKKYPYGKRSNLANMI